MLKIIGFYCHNHDNRKAIWHHGKDDSDSGKGKENGWHRYGKDKKNEGRNYSHSRGPRIVVFLNQRYIMKQQIIAYRSGAHLQLACWNQLHIEYQRSTSMG